MADTARIRPIVIHFDDLLARTPRARLLLPQDTGDNDVQSFIDYLTDELDDLGYRPNVVSDNSYGNPQEHWLKATPDSPVDRNELIVDFIRIADPQYLADAGKLTVSTYVAGTDTHIGTVVSTQLNIAARQIIRLDDLQAPGIMSVNLPWTCRLQLTLSEKLPDDRETSDARVNQIMDEVCLALKLRRTNPRQQIEHETEHAPTP